MSNRRLLLITVPWRRVCAALPAVALIAAGIAVSAPADAPGQNLTVVALPSESPAIVVPDTALSLPAPAGVTPENLPRVAPAAPAPAPVTGAVIASSSRMALDRARMSLDTTGIPVRALEGYRRAASLVSTADRACHIDWELLAAIGSIESDHARFGGNQLDAAGVAQPGIIGIPLDGTNQTARITDSDGGLFDRDSVFDRAVGPMQFIPSTWQVVGVDADGDGARNPQDMTDAASAAAIYLCSGPGDLTIPGELYAAVMRYNASDSYVRTVTALAATYRLGIRALPSQEPTLVATPSVTVAGPPILATALGQNAAATGAPAPPTTSVTALTVIAAPVTTAPVTTAPVTPVPTPILIPTLTATVPTPTLTATVPTPTVTVTTTPVPDPTATAPATTTPVPDPTATAPATTTPVPDPTATVPTPTATATTTPVPDPTPTATATTTPVPDPTPTPTP